MTVIIYCRSTASIAFHDVLHGFWEGSGKGTASLEAKPIHQLASIRKEVLYAIFMGLHMAYRALDMYI